MNLAHKFPTIFWNTANLIVESVGFNDEDEEDPVEKEAEEDCDDEAETEVKRAKKTINYGKISAAIGKFKSHGITILPPDINASSFTFTPMVEQNAIAYGLRGITRVSVDIVKNIMANRPFESVDDFFNRIKITKLPAINLIKSGAFDSLNPNREEIIYNYLKGEADTKKRLTLQNMRALIDYEIIPDDMKIYGQLFNFNKAIKAANYKLSSSMIDFIIDKCDADLITGDTVNSSDWDKYYKKRMDGMRAWLKENQKEALEELNNKIIKELVDKYYEPVSKGEMSSIGFYYHEHELESFKNKFDNFFAMPEEPVPIKWYVDKNGIERALYEPNVIVGTVIDKNKLKRIITLLTPDGVVNVKFYNNESFANYDRQISAMDEDGKKKIIGKSWFTRGTLVACSGLRRSDAFFSRTSKKSFYPAVTKINIINNELHFITEREDAQ